MEEIVDMFHSSKLLGMFDCGASLNETHRINKLSFSDGL